MNIALAQMDPITGDFQGNLAKCLEIAQQAQEQGAELVIFPQCALCGGVGENIINDRSFVVHTQAALNIFARRCPIPALIGAVGMMSDDLEDEQSGAPAQDAAVPREAIFFCRDGHIAAVADSKHLDGYLVFSYALIYCGFSSMPLSAYDDERRHVDACFIFDDCEYRDFRSRNGGVMPEPYIDMVDFATDEGVWMVYCNALGAQDSRVYPGGSCIIGPDGDVAYGVRFEEGILFGEICTQAPPSRFEPARPNRLDAEEQAASFAAAAQGGISYPFDSDDDFALGELYQVLVMATRSYFSKNGLADCVLGVSGGIDSALVAAIACDALGPEHVHGVLMPGPYSSQGSVDDALALAANLGFDTRTIPITPAFEALESILADPCGGAVEGLTRENLQARIRTLYVMTLSNAHGWIMLNTGNKSESAMGFSTLYGDTAGAIAPLGDVYKTQVYQLAHWLNREQEIIPQAIICKVPSAELHEGQRDDDRLPPYDVLDRILHAHIERGMDVTDIVQNCGFEPALVKRVLATVAGAEFKRRQEPFAPEVSDYSFQERAWPITNRFRDTFLPGMD
ncbi:MAG: NAD(+) synthase [Coriobacteriales bacterium]|nr:NAD(+) synthase [Coriobacteriales bacterium]